MKQSLKLLAVLLFIGHITNAQLTAASNGLTVVGTTVKLGVTPLDNARTTIDFGSSNSSSDLLIKKGTSNYLFISNGGNSSLGSTSTPFKLSLYGTASISDRQMGINGTQVLYLPDQSTFTGSLIVGDGFTSATSAIYNTSVGIKALRLITSGSNNSAFGSQSLELDTSGSANSAFGRSALAKVVSGNNNTAVGHQALYNNTGSSNTAVGGGSLYTNTGGNWNTSVGMNALLYSTGNYNVSIGGGTGLNLSTGSANTFVGYNTGTGITIGNNNTIIGANVSVASYASGRVIIADGVGNQRIYVDSNGVVLIGSVTNVPSGYKLLVTGGILTEKVKAALQSSSNWSDYVFDKEYKLKTLEEVEAYININKHLPGIPSSEELVKEGGIDMNQMFAKQMEKIEELTLYLIKLKKEVDSLKQEKKELKTTLTNK